MKQENITKEVAETTMEKKKKQSGKLFCVEEENDGEVEALLRRSQRQRSILDDILNQEDVKGKFQVHTILLKKEYWKAEIIRFIMLRMFVRGITFVFVAYILKITSFSCTFTVIWYFC